MTESQAIITRAFNANAAEFLTTICKREHIDLNSIKHTNDRFVIGFVNTGRYVTIRTVTDIKNNETYPTYTKLVFSVSTPGQNYHEHLSAIEAGAVRYTGEDLRARPFNVDGVNYWGLWSEEHQGFIGFDNKLSAYAPAGGFHSVKSLTSGGIANNAAIFICKI